MKRHLKMKFHRMKVRKSNKYYHMIFINFKFLNQFKSKFVQNDKKYVCLRELIKNSVRKKEIYKLINKFIA